MQHQHSQGTPAANRSRANLRDSDRFGIAMPITMEDDSEGFTHDLSATGVLFEASTEPAVGARIGMKLEYMVDGHNYQLRCEGEVVRVERHGERVNVAARLVTPLFEDKG